VIGLVIGLLLAGGAATGPLKLDVEVDPTIIVPTASPDRHPKAPHVASVRVTLTNLSDKERVLRFGSSCVLAFEVEAPDGTMAPPEGGGERCLAVVTEIRLAPGATETREISWTARSWDGSFKPFAPGKYKVYGTMGMGSGGADRNGHSPMRTAPVTVEVRPATN
jgi:hypothetical protein